MSQNTSKRGIRMGSPALLPTEQILPGVHWGHLEAFPSPAYWAHLARSAPLSLDTLTCPPAAVPT